MIDFNPDLMQNNQIKKFDDNQKKIDLDYYNGLNNRILIDFNFDYGAEKSDFGLTLCP